MNFFWISFFYYVVFGLLIYSLFYFSSLLSESFFIVMNGREKMADNVLPNAVIIFAIFLLVFIIVLIFAYIYMRSNWRIRYISYLFVVWFVYAFVISIFDLTPGHEEEHMGNGIVAILVSSPLAIGSMYVLLVDYNARYIGIDITSSAKTTLYRNTLEIIVLVCIIIVSNTITLLLFHCVIDWIAMRLIASCLVLFSLSTLEIVNGNSKGWIWIYIATSYILFAPMPVFFSVFILQMSFLYFDLFAMRCLTLDAYDHIYRKRANVNKDDMVPLAAAASKDTNNSNTIYTDMYDTDTRKKDSINVGNYNPVEWPIQQRVIAERKQSPRKEKQRNFLSLAFQNLLTEEGNRTAQEKKIED